MGWSKINCVNFSEAVLECKSMIIFRVTLSFDLVLKVSNFVSVSDPPNTMFAEITL